MPGLMPELSKSVSLWQFC